MSSELAAPRKLRWSDELGRMVLVSDDGTVEDVGFGEFGKHRKGDWWLEEVRRRADGG